MRGKSQVWPFEKPNLRPEGHQGSLTSFRGLETFSRTAVCLANKHGITSKGKGGQGTQGSGASAAQQTVGTIPGPGAFHHCTATAMNPARPTGAFLFMIHLDCCIAGQPRSVASHVLLMSQAMLRVYSVVHLKTMTRRSSSLYSSSADSSQA